MGYPPLADGSSSSGSSSSATAPTSSSSGSSGEAPQQQQQPAPPLLPPSDQLFWGGQTVELPGGRTVYGNVWPRERADTLRCKRQLFELYEEGRLEVWVDGSSTQFRGLEQVADAVDYMLTGRALGKVVVALP